jgi:murein DD-endopeptidase MepM/ murein hydrolase activator NlpD
LNVIIGFLLALFVVLPPASAGTLELKGKRVQGGLLVGRTDPGTKVSMQKRAIRVSEDGYFVVGFSRDAPKKSWLVLEFPDGTREVKTLHIKRRKYNIQRIDGLPPKMVTPPPETLARIRRENAMIGKARKVDTPTPFFLKGWIWPAQGRISGVYGSQRILNGEPRRPHYGVDVAAPVGTPVVAPSDGVVRLAATGLYYTGGTIILDHGHRLSSAFLHMQSVEVKVGQRVKQGERIGTIGATGRVTGPHLDWRMNLFGARLDPALLLPPMKTKKTKRRVRK